MTSLSLHIIVKILYSFSFFYNQYWDLTKFTFALYAVERRKIEICADAARSRTWSGFAAVVSVFRRDQGGPIFG